MLITNIFYITHIVVFLLPIQYFYISILHKQDFYVNDTGLPTPTNIYPQGTNYIYLLIKDFSIIHNTNIWLPYNP